MFGLILFAFNMKLVEPPYFYDYKSLAGETSARHRRTLSFTTGVVAVHVPRGGFPIPKGGARMHGNASFSVERRLARLLYLRRARLRRVGMRWFWGDSVRVIIALQGTLQSVLLGVLCSPVIWSFARRGRKTG